MVNKCFYLHPLLWTMSIYLRVVVRLPHNTCEYGKHDWYRKVCVAIDVTEIDEYEVVRGAIPSSESLSTYYVCIVNVLSYLQKPERLPYHGLSNLTFEPLSLFSCNAIGIFFKHFTKAQLTCLLMPSFSIFHVTLSRVSTSNRLQTLVFLLISISIFSSRLCKVGRCLSRLYFIDHTSYVMWSSKISLKSEILILRYSFLLFWKLFNCWYLLNWLFNFNGVFCKM